MPRVIVTEPVHEDALALLRAAGWTVEGPGAALTPAEALLVRTQAVPPEAVAGFKMISKHGAGVDNIPLEAAKAAGVTVMNTPGANAAAVAEQTLMLMLAMARDLTGQLAGTRQGVTGLEGRRLLVVGFGETGRRVVQAAMMLGLQVTVLAPRPDQVGSSGARAAQDLQSALRQTDILSLHCPLTPLTQGMIGAAELALLPPGALVVNVARGGLIDEAALADALHSGHLGGAALDVTRQEPLPADDPLRRAPRLILTPHAAGLGQGAFRRMGLQAAQNILDHAAGRPRADCTVAAGA
jgi:D-3-phosphoglycerate dehydrogenase